MLAQYKLHPALQRKPGSTSATFNQARMNNDSWIHYRRVSFLCHKYADLWSTSAAFAINTRQLPQELELGGVHYAPN
jgi:hypothetical protein